MNNGVLRRCGMTAAAAAPIAGLLWPLASPHEGDTRMTGAHCGSDALACERLHRLGYAVIPGAELADLATTLDVQRRRQVSQLRARDHRVAQAVQALACQRVAPAMRPGHACIAFMWTRQRPEKACYRCGGGRSHTAPAQYSIVHDSDSSRCYPAGSDCTCTDSDSDSCTEDGKFHVAVFGRSPGGSASVITEVTLSVLVQLQLPDITRSDGRRSRGSSSAHTRR